MADLFWPSKARIQRITLYSRLLHGAPRVDNQRVVSGIIHVIRIAMRYDCCAHIFMSGT
ncbi:hypothetical protein [Teichococcus aestuarii]|uniref:hypothetical protein n=1 Tax=Teichococcus aestuarii TaxID=568898 RepID=UPI0015E81BE8|nr:hypothetical protein [Pseudoroseomonas aestuarii]